MAESRGRWQLAPPQSMQLTRTQAAVAAAVGLPALYLAFATLSSRRNKRQPIETGFAAFLKQPAAAPASGGSAGTLAATDFGSFLKQRGGSASVAPTAELQQQGPPLTPNSVVVTIVFGTEYGFSKEIAEKLRDALRDSPPYWPRLLDMGDHPEGMDLSNEQALLLVCSTQGDGVPPAEAREFCDWLEGGELGEGALADAHFSVCALGDRSYEHFCACGKALDSRFEKLGARRFVPRTDVNREDWPAVDAWLTAVTAGLKELPLLPASETGHTVEAASDPAAAAPRWGKNRPYTGRVVAVEGLCNISSTDDKDTVCVEIDLGDSGISYTPGDALGICPSNRPQDVEQLLGAMGASSEEQVPRPGWPFREASPDVQAAEPGELPLRAVLTSCYDIRAPKPELLQSLLKALPQPPAQGGKHKNGSLHNGRAYHDGLQNGGSGALENGAHANGDARGAAGKQPASPEQQARRLRELLTGDIEPYLAARHVADVLADFPAVRLSTQQVLAGLRQLQPRLYSISSAQAEAPDRVQVTVAVVRYDVLGRERVGVTSTLLAERLQVGDTLPVYVSKNPDFRLPEDPKTPVVMVGPGTGLAPFRSFMQHRLLSAASCGPAVLFFGCRRADQDYLYGDLLQGWADAGNLELHTAFSRQQAKKVYVQDRVREAGARLWELLEAGAHFYVCGDAGGMAPAVQKALLDVIIEHQKGGLDDAEAYLAKLSQAGRYQRDVWLV